MYIINNDSLTTYHKRRRCSWWENMQYPFNDDLPNTELFDIQDVAVSILCRKPFIPSQSEHCIGRLPTQSLYP